MAGLLTATSFQTASGIVAYCNNPTVLASNGKKSKVYQSGFDGNTVVCEYWFDAGVAFPLPSKDSGGTVTVTAPPASIRFRTPNGQVVKVVQSGNNGLV